MALSKVTKQPYESFVISVDFKANMSPSETISSQTISCVDKDEVDATGTILSNPANNGSSIAQVRVSDGTEAASPYKITYKVVTSASNKWEYDLNLEIVEL